MSLRRADLTPLSTKSPAWSRGSWTDYQTVKAGDLLVHCEMMTPVRSSTGRSGGRGGESGYRDNRARRICKTPRSTAQNGNRSAKAQFCGAGRDRGHQGHVDRTLAERTRQEALIATKSATAASRTGLSPTSSDSEPGISGAKPISNKQKQPGHNQTAVIAGNSPRALSRFA